VEHGKFLGIGGNFDVVQGSIDLEGVSQAVGWTVDPSSNDFKYLFQSYTGTFPQLCLIFSSGSYIPYSSGMSNLKAVLQLMEQRLKSEMTRTSRLGSSRKSNRW
jgi:hypothetical protein